MRPLNAPEWLTARPIAHRGLHDAAEGVIENTLAAAEAAIAAEFAIECDVQLSRDEQVFVFHDDTLDRLTDMSGALAEKSAEEIRRARIDLHRHHTIGAPSPLTWAGRSGGSRGSSRSARFTKTTSDSDGAPPLPSPPPQGGSGQLGPSHTVIPIFSEMLALVAGRVPIVCELKSRFDGDWRIGERVGGLAAAYDGPLALKSFDPDLVAYLRLRYPRLGPPGRPCPIGIVAEASYDDPSWNFLGPDQKRACEIFDHRARSEPDFLSWNVDDLPHMIPFFEKEFHGLPVMTWTVRSAVQREAARKWADQIVFEGRGRPWAPQAE